LLSATRPLHQTQEEMFQRFGVVPWQYITPPSHPIERNRSSLARFTNQILSRNTANKQSIRYKVLYGIGRLLSASWIPRECKPPRIGKDTPTDQHTVRAWHERVASLCNAVAADRDSGGLDAISSALLPSKSSSHDLAGQRTTSEALRAMAQLALPISFAEFKMVRLLGKGAFGTVYQAVHLPSGSDVAVKILRARHVRRRHLRAELYALSQLPDHPCLPRFFCCVSCY